MRLINFYKLTAQNQVFQGHLLTIHQETFFDNSFWGILNRIQKAG